MFVSPSLPFSNRLDEGRVHRRESTTMSTQKQINVDGCGDEDDNDIDDTANCKTKKPSNRRRRRTTRWKEEEEGEGLLVV